MVRGYGVVEVRRVARLAYIVEGVWAESVMTSTRHSGEHIVFLLCSSLQQVAPPLLINTRCVASVSYSRLGFHYAQSFIYISIVAGRLRNGSEECITWLLKSVDLWLDNHNCDKGLGSTGGCIEGNRLF